MEMTHKQRLFADEYLIDLNATQAAIRAGYSKKTAYSAGQRLLKNVEVQQRVQSKMKHRQAQIEIESEYVLKRLVDIDQMDVLDILNDDGTLKPVKEWPKVWRQFILGMDVSEFYEGCGSQKSIAGLPKKIKWPDKLKNLELIGKHLGMFKELPKRKHSFLGADGKPMDLRARVTFVTPEGRK